MGGSDYVSIIILFSESVLFLIFLFGHILKKEKVQCGGEKCVSWNFSDRFRFSLVWPSREGQTAILISLVQ